MEESNWENVTCSNYIENLIWNSTSFHGNLLNAIFFKDICSCVAEDSVLLAYDTASVVNLERMYWACFEGSEYLFGHLDPWKQGQYILSKRR
jgi:hypothetical protein